MYNHNSPVLYLTVQSQEKKEEGLRGWWVGVSLGFLLVGFRRTKYITLIGLFYKEVGSYLEVLWLCEELDMFKVVSGTCPTCVVDKIWEWLIYPLIKYTNSNTILV